MALEPNTVIAMLESGLIYLNYSCNKLVCKNTITYGDTLMRENAWQESMLSNLEDLEFCHGPIIK